MLSRLPVATPGGLAILMAECNSGPFNPLLTLLAIVALLGQPAVLTANEPGLQTIIATPATSYFVATNGSDDGSGTFDHPWATINHAAEKAEAGDTIVVRGGRYALPAQVRLRNSGRHDAWITFLGYPGEQPILDAQIIPYASLRSKGLDNGAFQIEGVAYVRVANLSIVNSHDAGITIRDSSNIDLINNSTKGTFSSGIAVFDTDHDDKGTEHIRVIGNTITKATTCDLAPENMVKRGGPPHEALSIGGAVDFEVAYNHIYDSDKEGIDIKETSKRGKVHHNLVHNIDRQGIYVDAWFGEIIDIEIFSNVVHDCRGAGLVISAENGRSVEKVNVHNNLIFNNQGSGLYFSHWGVDSPRRNIQIANNTFFHNGYGKPSAGQKYYWLTGGLYFDSTNLQDISIRSNIFSGNRGFQIGYSERFLRQKQSWQGVARAQKIEVTGNLIHGRNSPGFPIQGGGRLADQVKIHAVNGNRPIFGDPLFRNPASQDFRRRNLPAETTRHAAGAYAPGSSAQAWWKRDFPPRLVRTCFGRSNLANVPLCD
jgi:Right handed beta helix region